MGGGGSGVFWVGIMGVIVGEGNWWKKKMKDKWKSEL